MSEMTKPEDVLYVHEPRSGEYVVGVPARDLTRADVDRMPPRRLHEAVATGLYRKASRDEKAEAAKEQAKAEKAAEGTTER
jgi:hypothetical protein